MICVILYYSSNSLQKQEANRIRDSVVVRSLPSTHPPSGWPVAISPASLFLLLYHKEWMAPRRLLSARRAVLPLDLAETTCIACLNPSGFARIRLLNSMYVQRVRLLLKLWIPNLLLKSVLIVSEHPTHPSLSPKKRGGKAHLLKEDSLGAGAGRALG